MAITEYYVSVAGAGAHDGTSTGNALTLTEMVTQINALGAGGGAGRRYNITGNHTGRGASDSITIGGTATSPLILRGYNATIGDLDTGTRDAYGALDTTNMPDIGYNATFKFTSSGSHTVFANLDFAGNRSGEIVSFSGGNQAAYNLRCTNTSTNASAVCYAVSATMRMFNCDFAGGASGGLAGIECTAGTVNLFGVRGTSAAIGIRMSQGAILNVIGCTIYNCGGDGIAASAVSATLYVCQSTIYGCVDGIDVVSTNSSVGHVIEECHITDNSGYGINFNGGTSGAYCPTSGNRFRDNTSGNVNGFADWITGTSFRNITTDTGGAATDYVDAATNKDFRLISTSPGYRQGFAYNSNIGACGDNVSAGASSTGPGFGRGAGRGF